ncbi:unnamed protein product [Closterium sp. NIES-64]|nr:unnamed protein product [Closterium sp. NIES-64]
MSHAISPRRARLALPRRAPCPPVVRPALPSCASALPLPSRARLASAVARALCLLTSRARAPCLPPSRAHDLLSAVTLPAAHSLLSAAALPSPPFPGHLPLPSWCAEPLLPHPTSPASFAPPPLSPLITSASYTPPPLFSPPYPSPSSPFIPLPISLSPPPLSSRLLLQPVASFAS